MAIGGALRAALKAGDFVKTAAESRRRARALAELNASGGLSGRMRNTLDDVYIADDIPSRMGGGFGMRSSTPDGRTVFRDADSGTSRMSFNPDMLRRGYNPIQAPYEGMRLIPQSRLATSEGLTNSQWYGRFGSLPEEPSLPWMGRGRAPEWSFDPGGTYGGLRNPTWIPDGYFPSYFADRI